MRELHSRPTHHPQLKSRQVGGRGKAQGSGRRDRTSSCTMWGWPAARRWNAICRRTAASSSAGPRSMKRITTGVSPSASRHRSAEVQGPLRGGSGSRLEAVWCHKVHQHEARRLEQSAAT